VTLSMSVEGVSNNVQVIRIFHGPAKCSAEVVAKDREVNKISLVSTSDNKTLREVLACIAQKIVLKLRVALK
jgi:hypothetical protein